MKITAIELTHLRLPLDPPFPAAWDPDPRTSFDATLVEVHTDEGLTGVGSGDAMVGFAEHAHRFIGEDPTAIARHVRTLETISYHGGRCWPLEAALWDLVGQACGQPVSVLFGGAADRVPAYASCGTRREPAEMAEVALARRAEGFRAMKLRIERDHHEQGIATVAAVREAVGPDFGIMVDMNQAWRMPGDIEPATDLPAARRIADALRELDILWMEEPLPEALHEDLRRLRSTTGVRVSGGEMIRTFPELLDAVLGDALDVYQPDVVLAGGMHRARTIAEIALARNRWFTPHTWSNGLGLLANLHVTAGVGGGPFLEFPFDPPGWTVERRDFLLAEPVRLAADGTVVIPDRPGLGAIIDRDAVDTFSTGVRRIGPDDV